MLLSIVMMVKNEEKYLDKTLYALNDLRKDIDTELIILDTGYLHQGTIEVRSELNKGSEFIVILPNL